MLPGSQRHSGERYRLLPLIATSLMFRPRGGRPEYFNEGCYEVTPLPGERLKHRQVGGTRSVEAARLVGRLNAAHVQAGYGSSDGGLFPGPAGGTLNVSNFTDDFFKPALLELLSFGGLWEDFGHLLEHNDVWYLMRKSGESIWLGCSHRGFRSGGPGPSR